MRFFPPCGPALGLKTLQFAFLDINTASAARRGGVRRSHLTLRCAAGDPQHIYRWKGTTTEVPINSPQC